MNTEKSLNKWKRKRGARDELSFLSPKIKTLNEELEKVKKELSKADEEINQVKLKYPRKLIKLHLF